MENKKISVIVPIYNSEQWLNKCIDSIINQTYKNLEIILIDDGCTDSSSQIIDKYGEQDKRVRVVHQKNVGLVQSRENGILLATGDYIAFVDSDDTISEDMYERLINNIIKYDADIAHCGVNFCYEDGRIESHYNTGMLKIQDNFEGLKDLLEGKSVEPGLWNKLYKKELLYDSCLDKTILNNEDLLRNYILFERAKKSVFEDFCGYQYMQREGSMSKDANKIVRISKHIMKARKLIVKNCDAKVKEIALNLWMSSIVNAINATIYSSDRELMEFSSDCRKILKKNKKYIKYLIPRQQIAAYIYIYVPFMYKGIYKIYKLVRR